VLWSFRYVSLLQLDQSSPSLSLCLFFFPDLARYDFCLLDCLTQLQAHHRVQSLPSRIRSCLVPLKLHLLVLRFFFRVWCCPRSAFLLRSRTHFLRSFVPVTAVCRPSLCLTNSLEQILFCLFPCSVCGSFLLRARQWRPEVWLPQEISVSDADCSSRLLCSTRLFGPSVYSAVQPSALAPRFVRPWSAPANPSVHVSSVLPF
jgi:hypothetical protein